MKCIRDAVYKCKFYFRDNATNDKHGSVPRLCAIVVLSANTEQTRRRLRIDKRMKRPLGRTSPDCLVARGYVFSETIYKTPDVWIVESRKRKICVSHARRTRRLRKCLTSTVFVYSRSRRDIYLFSQLNKRPRRSAGGVNQSIYKIKG